MNQQRDNPFGDLEDLIQTKPTAKPVAIRQIETLAQDHNFVSREPAAKTAPRKTQAVTAETVSNRPRRARVKREPLPQLNIKARAEVIQEFFDLADQSQVTSGEMLEILLAGYTKKPKR